MLKPEPHVEPHNWFHMRFPTTPQSIDNARLKEYKNIRTRHQPAAIGKGYQKGYQYVDSCNVRGYQRVGGLSAPHNAAPVRAGSRGSPTNEQPTRNGVSSIGEQEKCNKGDARNSNFIVFSEFMEGQRNCCEINTYNLVRN